MQPLVSFHQPAQIRVLPNTGEVGVMTFALASFGLAPVVAAHAVAIASVFVIGW